MGAERFYAALRRLIHEADPEIVEEWKWDTGVFSRNGIVCSVGAFAHHMKINFFKGAALDDHASLFNAGLDAKKSRAIDLYEGDKIRAKELMQLIKAAVGLNRK